VRDIPKMRAKLSYCLVLHLLFWECPHPRALPYAELKPKTWKLWRINRVMHAPFSQLIMFFFELLENFHINIHGLWLMGVTAYYTCPICPKFATHAFLMNCVCHKDNQEHYHYYFFFCYHALVSWSLNHQLEHILNLNLSTMFSTCIPLLASLHFFFHINCHWARWKIYHLIQSFKFKNFSFVAKQIDNP
jgi:hypothetical protein